MSRRTLFWIAGALVLGWLIRIPPFFLGTGTGEAPLPGAIIGFCVTVSTFFAPVLLNVVWWGTFGILGFAFWLSRDRLSDLPPST